jgi:hypothetical protein
MVRSPGCGAAERFRHLIPTTNEDQPNRQSWHHAGSKELELLRQASKGLPRQAGRILCTAMRLAVPKALNHLPDDLVQQAIAELQ